MKTFRLTISSPNGNLYDEDIVSVSLRGAEGDLAVMCGHIPFATYIKPSDCFIELPNGESVVAEIENGLLIVSKEKTTLLSGTFKWKK